MEILQSNIDKTILLNKQTDFKTDLGWEESFQEFEKDTLKSIINPSVNFETVRYIHKSCIGPQNIEQSDIWFYFYFFNNENPQTHAGGLNYEYVGLTNEVNSKVLRENNESFFRLEFYKVPEGQNPNSANRKLVFTKHLPIALGERVKYSPTNEYIFVPVFMGSNFRNKENMYLFWFQDNTVVDGTLISGNTFYMTARYFNTIDGSTTSFTTNDKSSSDIVNEETDVYYRMEIERTGYTYTISSGATEFGCSTNPIRFYEAPNSIAGPPPSPSPTPSITPSISTSPLPPSLSPSLTPSRTPSSMPTRFGYAARIYNCYASSCSRLIGSAQIQVSQVLTVGKFYTISDVSGDVIEIYGTAAIGGPELTISNGPFVSCDQACGGGIGLRPSNTISHSSPYTVTHINDNFNLTNGNLVIQGLTLAHTYSTGLRVYAYVQQYDYGTTNWVTVSTNTILRDANRNQPYVSGSTIVSNYNTFIWYDLSGVHRSTPVPDWDYRVVIYYDGV